MVPLGVYQYQNLQRLGTGYLFHVPFHPRSSGMSLPRGCKNGKALPVEARSALVGATLVRGGLVVCTENDVREIPRFAWYLFAHQSYSPIPSRSRFPNACLLCSRFPQAILLLSTPFSQLQDKMLSSINQIGGPRALITPASPSGCPGRTGRPSMAVDEFCLIPWIASDPITTNNQSR